MTSTIASTLRSRTDDPGRLGRSPLLIPIAATVTELVPPAGEGEPGSATAVITCLRVADPTRRRGCPNYQPSTRTLTRPATDLTAGWQPNPPRHPADTDTSRGRGRGRVNTLTLGVLDDPFTTIIDTPANYHRPSPVWVTAHGIEVGRLAVHPYVVLNLLRVLDAAAVRAGLHSLRTR